MLSTSTRVAGDFRAICRVASMPFSSGIATSMMATSGLCGLGLAHRLAAVAGFGHDFPFRPFFEHFPQTLADDGVIVGEEETKSGHVYPATVEPCCACCVTASICAGGATAASTGSRTVSRVPPSRAVLDHEPAGQRLRALAHAR